jgi:type I restriction enzyme S subunit
MKVKSLKIENVCDFVGGSQPPKSEFINTQREGYVRLIQTRDYKTDAFPTYIPSNSTKKICDADDIMIGRYGPPIFQICRGLTGAYNVALLKAKPKKCIDREYLYYFLKQKAVFQYVEKLSARTGGQTGVDLVSLNKYPIRLPENIDDQKNVVALLCALDDKIECNNRVNAELEAMAKALYEYWFLQFEFPNAKGKPYKFSGGEMVYNHTLKRDIPDGWTDGTLNDLGKIVGGSTPSTQDTENFITSGTPWITPYDLSNNQGNKFITRGAQDVSDAGIKNASLKKYPPGTVLLSSRAPIGYLAIARDELTTNQGFKSFIPNNGYSTAFIYYTVKGSLKAIIQYASGSTFQEISASVLKTVKIVLPESDIVDQFTKAAIPIFERQDLLEQENQHLTQLRDWLLPMLMNGQVSIEWQHGVVTAS